MLRHIKLLIFDLDYVVFDPTRIKLNALKQSLMPLADAIPQSVRLPDEVDIEEAFLRHGSRWLASLELGLDDGQMEDVLGGYREHEARLIGAGAGRVYPELPELLAGWSRDGLRLALGAEAERDYLLDVSDRHGLHAVFDVALCTQEYGKGSAQEMLDDVMYQAEVNPSETLVFGTREDTFEAARSLDVVPVGCGWGIRQQDGLERADLQSPTVGGLQAIILKADAAVSGPFD